MATAPNSHTALSAYLASRYQQLRLEGEEVGYSLWSGWRDGRRVAVHCIPEWAVKAPKKERLQRSLAALTENPVAGIPPFLGAEAEAGHLLFLQEWLESAPWSEVVLTRETALTTGVDLFNILSELHQQDLLHGRVVGHNLVISKKDNRLYLLGLVGKDVMEDLTPEAELARALRCLESFFTEEEMNALIPLTSGREIGKRLGRLLHIAGPEKAEPDLVGRDTALGRLNRALRLGGAVTLEARAGGGKSRLLREWAKQVEARVLFGKAAREVAPSPFQMFQGAFSQVEEEMKVDEQLRLHLQGTLGLRTSIKETLASRTHMQRSAMVWLARFLEALEEDRPTVLVLEDVHWADPFTVEFARFWGSKPRRSLLVLSFRPEEVPQDETLRTIDCPRITLPALSHQQAERLIRSVQPTVGETLVESVITRAGGNPFLLLQFLRSGAVRGGLYQTRVISLQEKTRCSLAVAAVLGDEFSVGLLNDCLDERASLEEALDQGLLEEVGDRRYRFTHDRFREACLCGLSSDQQAETHLKVARRGAAEEEPDPFQVAYHYQMARRPDLGLPFAVRAAAVARGDHDLGTAIYYLQAALAGVGEDQEAASRLHHQLGDSFRLVGRYAQSEECFRKALGGVTDPVTGARIKYSLGDVYFKQAKLEAAREVIVEALQELGDRLPSWLHGAFCGEAARLVMSLGRSPASPSGKRERELLRAGLYNRLAYVGWFLEGPVASIWAHLRELNIAKRYGDSVELARAQANHAMAMSAIPWWSRAVEYGAEALGTAKRVGDEWCEGVVGHFYGAALLGACRLREARDVLLEAREKLKQTGDRWEENGVCYHLAIVYYRMGVLDTATDLARRTQMVGVEINDRLAAGDNLNTWARARHGRVPRVLIDSEKAYSSPDVQRACELLCAEAIFEIRERHYSRAVKLLEGAQKRYREKGVSNLYSALIPCWLATALRLELQTVPPGRRTGSFRRVRKVVAQALKLADRYRTNLPHALREQGLLSLLEGRPEAARQYLLRSSAFAAEKEMLFESRLSAQVLKHFCWILGAPERDSEQLEASEYYWLLGIEEKGETEHAGELDNLLTAATRITHCLSVSTALHQLCEGCRLVLGEETERAVVRLEGQEVIDLTGSLSGEVPSSPFPRSGWTTKVIPGLEESTLLLVRKGGATLDKQGESLVDFLVTVTAAVVDRAGRTAFSTVLSRDLQRSTDQLNQESAQLYKAREQLLLSERLALTGRLAAGLVHDLRNLILSVNASAELLTLNDRSRTREVDEILSAGRKSNQLLDHLSGICRGEVLGPQLVCLNDRVWESGPLLRSLCGPLVELDFQLGEVPPVKVDPLVLDRVLLNLVMNARDAVGTLGEVQVATELSRVDVEMRAQPVPVPIGCYGVLTVADDGPGISPDVLPRIFELHFTTKKGTGTGVGLATVKEMVTESGGYITVESKGEGTRFKIFLPTASLNLR